MNLQDENEKFLPLEEGIFEDNFDISEMDLKAPDKWMISRLNDAVEYVT